MIAALRNALFVSVIALGLSSTSSAPARTLELIDFEKNPGGGTPVDNQSVSNPYNLTVGGTVRFFFDTNGDGIYNLPAVSEERPIFESFGTDTTEGFQSSFGSGGGWDRARAGSESQLGSFFLRGPTALAVPAPFYITYNSVPQAITAFSGEIWDIDGSPTGTEQWRVEALNASGQVLASLDSPVGDSLTVDSLDSLPWVFGFTNLPAGFTKARITFIGSKTSNVGLALNNFSPLTSLAPPVPEPSSIVLTGIAFAVAAGCHYRKRRRTAA